MSLSNPSAGDASQVSDVSQYKDHLEGASGSDLAWFFRSSSGNDFTVRLADAAGARDFVIQDSGGSEVATINSDGDLAIDGSFAPGTLLLPSGASVAPTAEGSIAWDSDDDLLKIGTGAGTASFDPASAVVNHSDLGSIGADDHHTRDHAMTGTSDHSATAWRTFYSDGSGNVIELGLGASATVLTSNGSAAAPSWGSVGGSHATDHSDGGSDEVTVENLAATSTDTSRALRPDGSGGLAFSDIAIGDITATADRTFYSNGSGVVTQLVHGTSGYVLTSNGASSAPSWQDPATAVALHASTHIRGATDEVDGDRLDIDWNPATYTPATTPSEVTSSDHLTAHLYGIDQEFHAESHTVASHSDTSGTGAELNTLTGGGDASSLHTHGGPVLLYSNNTQQSTASTSEVDILDITGLSISATHGIRLEFNTRVDNNSAGARTALYGLHVNGTEMIAPGSIQQTSAAGQDNSGNTIFEIPPRSTNYDEGGMYHHINAAGGSVASGGITATNPFPTATVTSLTIRGYVNGADGLAYVNHVRVWEFPD